VDNGVEEKYPKANFSVFPRSGDIHTKFVFDPSPSIPSIGGEIINYLWNFGDGENIDIRYPKHTYEDDGVYIVSLQVKDDITNVFSEYFNISVIVKNLGPSAHLKADNYTIRVGDPIEFNASQTTDLDDTLFEPEVRFIWYFGDEKNSTYSESSIHYPDGVFDKCTSFIFNSPGEYFVKLVIYDDDQARNETTISITVLDKPSDIKNETKDDELNIEYMIIVSIIIVVIIVLFTILIIISRRKKRTSKTGKDAGTGASAVADLGLGMDIGYGGEGYKSSTASSGGTSLGFDDDKTSGGSTGTLKKKSKQKSKGKITTKTTRTNHFQPPAVEVTLPEEKVVEWKAEDTTKEHVLSLKEVTVVSDKELLDASMISLDDNGKEYDLGDSTLETEPEFSESEKDDAVEWLESEIEIDYEHEQEFEEIDLEKNNEELIEDEEFEIEPDYDDEPDLEEDEFVDVDEEESEESLVFEFEDNGQIMSKEVHEDRIVTEPSEVHRTQIKPKKKRRNMDKDPLIPIPGIGFVRRSELQNVLGIGGNTLDQLRAGKIKYKDIKIPEGVPLKISETNGHETSLTCKLCFRPIKGKFIRVRRKGDDGTDIGIVGPFCSPECASKFQNK
jgi:PKD repeat protein